ncbi:hypothetical protein MSAN_01809000 [Mycena sanguinolenta]|uniref:Uncharacterized protein n=1 Tax=Mycena sanguinolenta TaxID=230812 RepID=A0A8H6XUB3_9AGAR|nr:hypothetical protein MSAN_01809000 [Mycena sanguinolenta]
MRIPLTPFALVVTASALIINAPSTASTGAVTLTYISQATDLKGSLTFWISHPYGIGGFTDLVDNVPPNPGSTAVPLTVVIPPDFAGQYFISAGVTGETVGNPFGYSAVFNAA